MNKYNIKFISIVVLFLLIGSFFLGRCSDKSENIKRIEVPVYVPGVKGTSVIIEKPIPYEVLVESLITNKQDSILFEENKRLVDNYSKLKSELDKINTYNNAISIKKYNIPYEDEFIKTNALITTRGNIESFQQLYEIKPRIVNTEIELPKEKSFLGIKDVYIGGGISNNVDLTKFNFEASLGLGLKNGDIIEGAYDTNKNIHVRYKFNL